MSWHCKQFRKERHDEGKGSHRSGYALEQLEKMYAQHEPEVITALNDCNDEMSHLLAADDAHYYRAGVEDGIRIDQLIKQIKAKQEQQHYCKRSICHKAGVFLMSILGRSVSAYGNIIRTVSVKG